MENKNECLFLLFCQVDSLSLSVSVSGVCMCVCLETQAELSPGYSSAIVICCGGGVLPSHSVSLSVIKSKKMYALTTVSGLLIDLHVNVHVVTVALMSL